MGFIFAIGIISVIVGLVLGIYVSVEHGKQHPGHFVWLLVLIGFFIGFYVYQNEDSYYIDHGKPHISYTQVQAMSEHRLSSADDTSYTGGTFTITKEMVKGVNQGDIVKITYVDAIFHAYALKVEKLEVKG